MHFNIYRDDETGQQPMLDAFFSTIAILPYPLRGISSCQRRLLP